MPVDTDRLRRFIEENIDHEGRPVRSAVIAALQAAEALDAHIMQRADWPLAKWLIKLGELTGAVQTTLAALPQSPPPEPCVCKHTPEEHRPYCGICGSACYAYRPPTPAAGAGQ